ncbi:pseudouridine synthase [Marinilabilia sp.]|uniref:pseudouridine synthase n=1 Tax=Marinilabilia sp. TaxID=2021252 RepID=UPI0025BA52DA|nr:pseudouridine synthase [Marinilabilia sp.]
MANKGKIPGKYTNNERRSRNTKFSEKAKPRNIERKISGTKPPESMRLNKFIANSGVCSRREADTLITKGEIKVNGNVVKEMGLTVSINDKVEYKGKKLIPEKKVYLLLNKPKDTVTTSSDPEGRKTVIEIIRNACPQRVYPVGRLDRNTTGVLLLTNDGELSKQLTHPSFEAKKIYHVFLNQPLAPAHLESIKNGIELEDGLVKPDAVNYVDGDPMQAGIEIHSGKNRIVRRIFEHFGYQVEKLDRVYFAGLTKKNLPRGKWRFLADKEVRFLKAGIKTPKPEK